MIRTVGPLFAALVYSVAVLLIRKSDKAGTDTVTRAVTSLLFLSGAPLAVFLVAGEGELPQQWLWPAVAGACFIGGQIFTLIALELGDSSVQTPLMGVKAILVPMVLALGFGSALSAELWTAAGITAAAVFVIGYNPRGARNLTVGTVVASVVSAVLFAATDAIVSEKAVQLGRNAFLSGMLLAVFATAATAAAALVAGNVRRPKGGRTGGGLFLLLGSTLLAVQFGTMVTVIGTFGNGAEANILYSTRGLWSVVLLLLANSFGVGHHMEHADRREIVRRFAGAALLIVAVVIVV